MSKVRFTLKFLAVVVFTLTVASMAQAQATRTWVSGVGDDANPCSRTAPCKTFAGAISKTAAGGEISALDPGGFGALTITKAINVNGEGTLAGILSSLVNGIVINAGANDVVNIRYISINGAGNGLDAIRVLSAKAVNIENVSIAGFTGDGVDIIESSDVVVSVVNTTIKNCTGAGIKVETTAGTARATIRNTTITNTGTGVNVRRNSRVSVLDSTLSFNTLGVHSEGNGASAVTVLKGCQIANNTSHGIQAGGGAATTTSTVRISDNIVNNNAGAGVSIQANGNVDTFMNNEIIGNNPDGCVGCINASGSFN